MFRCEDVEILYHLLVNMLPKIFFVLLTDCNGEATLQEKDIMNFTTRMLWKVCLMILGSLHHIYDLFMHSTRSSLISYSLNKSFTKQHKFWKSKEA